MPAMESGNVQASTGNRKKVEKIYPNIRVLADSKNIQLLWKKLILRGEMKNAAREERNIWQS